MCPGSQPVMQNTATTQAIRMISTIQAKISKPDMIEFLSLTQNQALAFNSSALCRASTSLLHQRKKGVDGRDICAKTRFAL
jgi:hypothetical protein